MTALKGHRKVALIGGLACQGRRGADGLLLLWLSSSQGDTKGQMCGLLTGRT